jgi:hypothetical protein
VQATRHALRCLQPQLQTHRSIPTAPPGARPGMWSAHAHRPHTRGKQTSDAQHACSVSLAGAFYLRLVGKAVDVYTYLEPLYNDNRRIRLRTMEGHCVLTHIDEIIDDMLRKDYLFDVAMPHIPARWGPALLVPAPLRPAVLCRAGCCCGGVNLCGCAWEQLQGQHDPEPSCGHSTCTGRHAADDRRCCDWHGICNERRHALNAHAAPHTPVAVHDVLWHCRCCRHLMERTGALEPRVSVLDEEFDEAALAAEEEEAAQKAQEAAAQAGGGSPDRERERGEREGRDRCVGLCCGALYCVWVQAGDVGG